MSKYEIFLLLIVRPCSKAKYKYSAVIAGKESEEEGADEKRTKNLPAMQN